MTRKYWKSAGILMLSLLGWDACVSAQQPSDGGTVAIGEEAAVEHGKINTADASPVDPGHYEIEASYTYAESKRFWDNDGDSHVRGLAREQIMGLAVTVGIIENVDVALGGSYMWLKDNDNDFDQDDAELGPVTGNDFADLDLSARYRFYQNKEQSLELAYIGGLTVPTGTSADGTALGTSQEFWSFNQTLVASKDWGQWTANVDIGYALPLGNKRENARGTFSADLAVGYQVLPWLQPEVELNYGYDLMTDEDDAKAGAVTVGLVMPVSEQLRVNLGLQQGLWGENSDKATVLSAAVKGAF